MIFISMRINHLTHAGMKLIITLNYNGSYLRLNRIRDQVYIMHYKKLIKVIQLYECYSHLNRIVWTVSYIHKHLFEYLYMHVMIICCSVLPSFNV